MGYPGTMTQRKRTPLRIEAEKRYEERRAKKPIGFRVSDEDMALIDAARGGKSRAEFALEATIKAARRAAK